MAGRVRDDLCREIEAAGWVLLRNKRHLVYACPCGRHLMTMGSTPGEYRAAANTRAQFNRLRRECAGARQEVPA